jgi:hypothetical protein
MRQENGFWYETNIERCNDCLYVLVKSKGFLPILKQNCILYVLRKTKLFADFEAHSLGWIISKFGVTTEDLWKGVREVRQLKQYWSLITYTQLHIYIHIQAGGVDNKFPACGGVYRGYVFFVSVPWRYIHPQTDYMTFRPARYVHWTNRPLWQLTTVTLRHPLVLLL